MKEVVLLLVWFMVIAMDYLKRQFILRRWQAKQLIKMWRVARARYRAEREE